MGFLYPGRRCLKPSAPLVVSVDDMAASNVRAVEPHDGHGWRSEMGRSGRSSRTIPHEPQRTPSIVISHPSQNATPLGVASQWTRVRGSEFRSHTWKSEGGDGKAVASPVTAWSVIIVVLVVLALLSGMDVKKRMIQTFVPCPDRSFEARRAGELRIPILGSETGEMAAKAAGPDENGRGSDRKPSRQGTRMPGDVATLRRSGCASCVRRKPGRRQ